MSKKYAFLFPGQGAQAPGMAKDIAESSPAAKKVIDDISAITGLDMAKLLWESTPEDLARSDNSQIAITAASLATMAALKEKGIEPSSAMGKQGRHLPRAFAGGYAFPCRRHAFADSAQSPRRSVPYEHRTGVGSAPRLRVQTARLEDRDARL